MTMDHSFRLLPFMVLWTFLAAPGQAQISYEISDISPVTRHSAINFSAIEPGFEAEIEYREAPHPSGDSYKTFLRNQKAKAAERFPRKAASPVKPRSSADTPEIIESFLGNNSSVGRPLDNHLAVSNDGQVVSVINFHFAAFNPDGSWIKGITFTNLFKNLNLDERIFDPRILYDPAEDRWILAMKAGSECENSGFVFGFSQTNNAAGDWNFYVFDGCPNDNSTFADFPMLAITQDELFYTYNAVNDTLSWQEGFVETIILQINKHDGYAGADLRTKMWSDIKYNDKPIRNICPVKSATEELYTNCYLLSDRNFDIANDTFFILEITGPQDDDNLSLEIDVRRSNQPYGVPPDALQPKDFLATNDARVLDAIRYEDWIQFVGNTRDLDNGNAAVYHGYIENISDLKEVHGYVLSHFDSGSGLIDLGYPGIAFTGQAPSDRDVIIVASHASQTVPPGHSACYAAQDESHSEWLELKTGEDYIEMIINSEVERWGDYAGAQRKYNEPGVVWVSASWGQSDHKNNTWISSLQPAGQSSSTDDAREKDFHAVTFPNPARDKFRIRFTLSEIQQVQAAIYDLNGRLVDTIIETTPRYAGEMILHFTTAPLAPGTYIVEVTSESGRLFSEKVVVE